jgi:hypothetical protein
MSFRRWFESRPAALTTQAPLTEREAAIIEKIAAKVVSLKMTVPAILFLESVKPLNYIGAQALIFFEPFVQTLFNFSEYDTFREMMERRENVERLLLKIEELDAKALAEEKAARKTRRDAARQRRRKWFGRRRGSAGTTTTDGVPPN